MAVEAVNNYVSTTLNGAISSTTATSFTVASASGFPTSGQYRAVIDSEVVLITGGQGTLTWTVARGQEGTTAATHAAGATVIHELTAGALANLGPSGYWPSIQVQATNLMGAIQPARFVGTVAGAAPTGGPYNVGDYVLDTHLRQWICTVAGSPGTWKPVGTGDWTTRAYLAANVSVGTTGWSQVVGLTTDYDPGSLISGNTVVIPTGAAGEWDFSARVQINSTSTELSCKIEKNGVDALWGGDQTSTTTGTLLSGTIKCAVADVITFWIFNGATTTLQGGTHFTYLCASFRSAA